MRNRLPTRLMSVGSIVADVRITVPNLPPRGGDVLGAPATTTAGGGFNILAAAARNKLPSVFAGQHGTGPFGARIRAELQAEGIGLLHPPCATGDSGFCLVLVEPDGERTFVTSPGVEAEVGARALSTIPLATGDAVFVSGYDLCYPDLGRAIAAWVAECSKPILLTIDPGPLVADIPPEILDIVLAHASILTMNRRESRLLAETEDVSDALDRILPRLTDNALLILRNGADGCFLAGRTLARSPHHIPAPAVVMVDSTGAGDAHTGLFLAGLAQGYDPVTAVWRANAGAAIAVTRPGPATAPNAAELNRFLSERRMPDAVSSHLASEMLEGNH